MFRSLRNQLTLSHILPILLLIPLMGVAMVFVLESRLLLPMIYQNLWKDTTLMAEITRNQPVFWENSLAAQAFVDGVSPYLSGRLYIITLNGRILAATDFSESADFQVTELPDLRNVDQGQVVSIQRGPLAESFTPVYDLNGQMIGIIRMTTEVVSVSEEIYQLRYLLGVVLLFGVLAGVGLGSYLAFNINRPIQGVTRSIQSLVAGDERVHVSERGPDELRTLARVVNSIVDQLKSLEQARRQLLANLIHEIGRPLGAIRSAVQALLRGADQDPKLAEDLLTGLDSETSRLQRLLDDLSGLYDMALGGLEMNKKPVETREWLVGILPAWEAAAREKGLLWEEDCSQALPVVVLDPDRVGQALGNLLSNAVKYTPEGGKIVVRSWAENQQFVFEVEDSGPGIPIEEQGRIFGAFFQGSHGRKIVQGMGLGLSIARDIITAHGGEIEVHSKPGEGSRFIVWLPVQPQD